MTNAGTPRNVGSATLTATSTNPVTTMFQGFNTFNGSSMSTAVSGTSGDGGAMSVTECSVCTDFESVTKSLRISASASYSLGFDTIDAKTTFLRSLQITTFSVTLVVYSNIITSQPAMTGVTFNRPNDLSDLPNFCRSYGDSFVSNIVFGGEYMATYVFYAQTEGEQTDISGQLSAATRSGVTADLQTTLNSMTKSVQVRWFAKSLITGVSTPQPTSLSPNDPEEMVSYALTFNQNKPDRPVVIEYGTTGYERVPWVGPNAPDFSQVITNRNWYLGGGGVPGLSQDLFSLEALNNQVAWIEQCYKTYGYTKDTDLSAKAAQISTDEATVYNLIGEIALDPTKSYTLGPLPSLAYGSPSLNTQLPYPTDCWGCNNCTKSTGTGFQDVKPVDILNQVVPTSIVMRGHRVLDQLAVTYSGKTAPIVHGGTGGDASNPFNLKPGEFITAIKGTAGDDINQLVLTTPSQSITWPPSPESAQPFSWTIPAPDDPTTQSKVMVGFQGRAGTYNSGQYVYSLSPLVLTLSPATWG